MQLDCIIQTCSPVHVGCGEVYEPTGFVMDETRQCLKVFDPLSFIAQLPPQQLAQFSEICQAGHPASLQDLYKFMHRQSVNGREIQVCKGFVNHYDQVLKKSKQEFTNALTQFAIERTSFCAHDQRAYLPGSSVKGALRTAFLNMMAANMFHVKTRDSKELEAKLLGLSRKNDLFQKDPFREVKVSDFMPVGNIEQKVIYAVDVKKKSSESGTYQILETIQPGAMFRGTLTFDFHEIRSLLKSRKLAHDNAIDSFRQACRQFYMHERNIELQETSNMQVDDTGYFSRPEDIPLRVGRHSGATCVTIEGYRQIKIKNLNKCLDHATTIWLACNDRKFKLQVKSYPFGWVKLNMLTSQDKQVLDNLESQFQKDRSQLQAERARQQKEAAIRIEAEKQKALEQAKAAEEASRMKALEQEKRNAMSDEDRRLYDIDHDNIPFDKIKGFIKDLGDIQDSSYQVKLATAIKSALMRHNEWDLKKYSKKQKKKYKPRNESIEAIISKG